MKTIMVLFLAVAIAVPNVICAADFKFYASVRQGLWFESERSLIDTEKRSNYLTYIWTNNSRFGTTIESDIYKGTVEFGLRSTTTKSDILHVKVRHAFSEFAINNNLTLTLGHTQPPFDIFGADQWFGDNNAQEGPMGSVRHFRCPLIQFASMGAKLAIIPNDADYIPIIFDMEDGYTLASKSTTSMLPGCEARYGLDKGIATFNLYGAFNMFEQDFTYKKYIGIDSSLKTEELSIIAFAVGVDGTARVSIFSLSAGFYYGNNIKNAGIDTWQWNAGVPIVKVGLHQTVTNNRSWGLPTAVRVSLNEKLNILAGFGMNSSRWPNIKVNKLDAILGWGFFGQVNFIPYPSLMVTPEFGYHDQTDALPDECHISYIGVHIKADL